MPDASGKPLAGEAGYVAPSTDPNATQPGLINTTPGSSTITPGDPVTGYTPESATTSKAEATGYDATPYTVGKNQTVSDQIKGIIDENSPLMQQAAARAAGAANSRGLLNSSIAVGAGQSAVLDAAMPIAQADAATYDRAATNTANAENTASQFTAGAENAESNLNAQLETGTSQSNANAQNTSLAAAAAASNQLKGDLQKIAADGTIRQNLAQIEAGYKTLMQTSASASDLYKQSVANFAAIIADPNIADKTGALNLGVKQLNDALALIGEIQGLNLGSYLTFDSPGSAPTPAPVPAQSTSMLSRLLNSVGI